MYNEMMAGNYGSCDMEVCLDIQRVLLVFYNVASRGWKTTDYLEI